MKNTPIILMILMVVLAMSVSPALSVSSWQEVTTALMVMNEEGRSRTEMIQQLLKQDENTLRETLAHLRQEVKKEQTQLEQVQSQLAGFKEEEQQLRHELAAEQEEIEGIQGTVLGAAKQINELFEHSPLGPEMLEARKRVDDIMAKKAFPGMDEIRGLAALCRQYFQKSAQVRLYQGPFFAGQGKVETGEIGRIGALGAVFRTKDQLGYLQANGDGRELVAVNGQIPGSALSGMEKYLQGSQNHLPLDISGGAVFLQLTRNKSIMQWLESGGLLVWPIIGIGVIAVLLALERIVFFLRIRANSDTILRDVTQLVQTDKIEESRQYCERKKNYPTCQILGGSLQHIGQSQEVLDNALEESLLKQMPRFERFLPTLAMFAAISPLLGLLGTVTGMISTFQVINIFGTGDPKMMSGGISEALITTQVGLTVAIPILFLHHIFERRVDNMISDLEEKGTAFKITLMKTGRIRKDEDCHAA